MSLLRVSIRGVGLLGPGLASWTDALPVLRGESGYVEVAPTLVPPPRLPPAERRRAGPTIRLAMAIADAAVHQADVDPATLATVFAASGGEGSNCHTLCETLAGPDRHLSPTRFTNSVHNAAAGYWHIAVGSRAASTSLSAYDGSFTAGLIEAATQVHANGAPVLLVACDVPYPEPLNTLRPIPHPMGVALVLGPADSAHPAIAEVGIELVASARAGAPTACADAGLEALRPRIPAAAALPLLIALARRAAAEAIVIGGLPASRLRLSVAPGAAIP